MIPKILKKLKKEPAVALFIMPDWCKDKYKMMFPRII
jgi:hypothetical protein